MLDLNFLVNKNGEEDLDTVVLGADTYVGGMPAAVTANGKVSLCKSKACAGFVGLLRNDLSVDAALGKVTYVTKGSIVTISPSSVSGANVYPYIWAGHTGTEAYAHIAPANYLYIDAATGKWVAEAPAFISAPGLLVMKKVSNEGLVVEILSPVIPILS